MAKYRVLRRHDGDKEYHEGDERTLAKAEAKHLVDLGVLAAIDGDTEAGDEDEPAAGNAETRLPLGSAAEDAAKSEEAPANKAEKSAPKNKAAH